MLNQKNKTLTCPFHMPRTPVRCITPLITSNGLARVPLKSAFIEKVRRVSRVSRFIRALHVLIMGDNGTHTVRPAPSNDFV
jgi:hypothetical protein